INIMSDAAKPSASAPLSAARENAPELLHELFERQAKARPSAVAVVCGAQSLAYEKIKQRAEDLAEFLGRRGIGFGDSVGLFLPRSAEVYVGMLGILKAGAAYVPLDADYPAERVNFILSDCRARGVVTSKELAERLGGSDVSKILLD